MTISLDLIQGFEAETLDISQITGSGNGIWDQLSNNDGVAMTFVAGRTGGSALHIINNGTTATSARRVLPVTQHRMGSYYFRIATPPAVLSDIGAILDATNAPLGILRVDTTGFVGAKSGSLGGTNYVATNVCDNAWHKLDYWCDTSGTTWRMNFAVDGVEGTDSTSSGVATDGDRIRFGTGTNAHTVTVDFDDIVVRSADTSPSGTEWIYGAHHVLGLVPIADGTHAAGTVIEDNLGNDITSGNAAWSRLDEWPAQTSVYVRQSGVGGSNYAEVTFETGILATGEVIAGVMGYAALFASSSTGDNLTAGTIVVDKAGGTLATIYSGDQSTGSLNYRTALVPSGGAAWTESEWDRVAMRVGYATDVTPLPRWSALMLQVAILEPTTRTVTHTVTGLASVRRTKTHTTTAVISSAIISKTHTATAVIQKQGLTKQHTADAEVTGGPARRVNSFEGGTGGVAITTANSGGASGDAFQDNVVGVGSTALYDGVLSGHGSVSGRIDPATTLAYFGYTTGLGTQSSIYGRTYLRLDALPTNGITLVSIGIAGVSTISTAITVNSAGRLRILDSTSTQVAISPNDPTGIVPALTWVRIEWHAVGHPSAGSVEVRLYLDPTSLTPDSTTSATGMNTTGAFSRYRVGKNNPTAADEVAFNVDEIGWDTADWLGLASDRRTLGHSVTAIIKATRIKTHLTDARILKALTKTHTADARILLAPAKPHTVTAIVKSTLTLAHTADAYLFAPRIVEHRADAIVAGGFIPGPNAWVVVDVAVKRATGTVPLPTVTDTLGSVWTTEATVPLADRLLARYYTRATANPLPRSVTVSFGADVQAAVLVEVYQILGAVRDDPFVLTYPTAQPSAATQLDVVMQPYANVSNRGLFAALHAANEVSNNEAGWTELADLHTTSLALATAWSDAEDDSATYTWATSSTSIGIASEIQVFHTGSVEHDADAIVSKRLTLAHTVTANVMLVRTKTHTVTAVVGALTQLSHQADAFLIGLPRKSHTATAVVKGVPAKAHTVTAVITEVVTPPAPAVRLFPGHRLALATRGTTGLGTEIISDILTTTGVYNSFQLTYEEELNESGRLEFALPIDHSAVTRANFAVGEREIHLHRGDGDELVWAGTLQVAQISGIEVRFVAIGWYDLLKRRTIKQDYTSRATFNPQTGWTYLDQLRIVRELVDIMQAEDPVGLTFQDPSQQSGVTRKLTLCSDERAQVSDVIEEFASAINGFDFAVLPDKRIQFWVPRRESSGPVASVDGTESFSNVTYTIDAADMATRVSGIGPDEECDTGTDVDVEDDAAAIARYGVLDMTVDLQRNKDDPHRTAIVTESLVENAHPRFSTEVTLPTLMDGVPDPSAYAVGDTITVTASRGAAGGFGSFSLSARILKRRVVVTVPGYETVILTIDVEGVS